MRDITDEDILAMKRVTPQEAACYLGVSVEKVRDGIRSGAFRCFGTFTESQSVGERGFYDIRPLALVRYNHFGLFSECSTPALTDESCRLIAQYVASAMRGENNQ